MAMNEEVGTLKAKIELDSVGFQDGISKINRQLKVVQSEFQATAAELSKFGSSTDALRAKADALTKQIELQRAKVELLQNAVAKSAAEKGEAARQTDLLTIKLNKARAQLATLESELSRATAELQQSAAGLQRASDSAEHTAGVFARLGEIIKSSVVFTAVYEGINMVTDAFREAIAAGFEFDSNLQQNQIAFSQMLGSAEQAQQMLQQLTQFAASTPFELTQVEGLAKQLLSFGFSAQQIIPMLTAIGDAAAGLGLGAEGAERLAIAIGQIQAKGRVQSDELLQLTEAGVPALQILAQAYGVTTTKMQEMVSKGLVPADKAIQALLAGMEQRFPHMMDAQSKSFQGLMSTLGDNLKQVMGAVVKPEFDWLTNTGLPALNRALSSFAQTAQQQGIGAALANLFPPSVRTGFQSFVESIKLAVDELRSAFSGDLGAKMSAFFAPLRELGPVVGDALSKIGALVHAMAALFAGDTGRFKAIMEALQVPPSVQQMLQNVASTMREIYQTVAPAFGAIFKQIFDYIKQNGPEIAQALKNAMSVIAAVFNAVWPVIKVLVIDTLKAVMDAIKNAVKVIEDIISVFADLFTGNWGKLWQDIKSLALDGLKLLWDVFQVWIGGKIFGLLKGLGGTFGKLIGDAMGKLASGVRSGWEAVVKYFSGRVSYFGGLVKQAFSVVTKIPADMLKAGRDIVNGLWNGIASMGATLKANVSKFIDEHIPKVVRDILGIKSPSRVMATAGGDIAQGLVVGIQRSAPAVHKASATMANRVVTAVKAAAPKAKTAVQQTAQDIAQSFLDGIQNRLAPYQQTIDQLRAQLQFRQDQGNTAAIQQTTNALIKAYKQEIVQLQSAMNSINAEIKRLNPKKQADDIAKLREEWSRLNVEWWQAQDELLQLNKSMDQTAQRVTNLINQAGSSIDPLQKQISVLQAQLQYLRDAGQDTSAVTKQIASAYQQEIKAIQSSINTLQAELKKLNPKTQGDLITQVKDKIADLNAELWQTRDALQQLQSQAWQQAADAFKSIADQQIEAINTALQSELSAIQQAHQQALAAFDAETQAMEAAIDAQIAALQQQQTQDERAAQQQQWDVQMADLQHQLAVAQMMNDPRTVKQVQAQIDQLNQEIARQKKQWAIQDQEQALQQQKQQLEAQRAQLRAALDQEWQDREAAFQRQMEQTQQHFQALEAALVQALQTGKMTLDQANAAWLQAIKDTGDQQVVLQIQAQQKSQAELNKWVQSYLDIGKKYGTSLGQGLVAGLNSMLAAVQAAAAQLANAASAAIGAGKTAIATATASIKVPALAAGGILSGPTLALAGEAGPEAVIPLNDSTLGRLAAAIVAQMGGARGRDQQPINVYIGNELVASYVWDYGLQRAIERQRKG
jgi:tape measure domain-containing protein